jgi:hypothetical protein
VAKGSRLIILQAIGFVPNALTIFKYVVVVDNASYHNVQRLHGNAEVADGERNFL